MFFDDSELLGNLTKQNFFQLTDSSLSANFSFNFQKNNKFFSNILDLLSKLDILHLIKLGNF